MIVIDTSAWVEYLRGTGSPAHLTLRRLLGEKTDLAVTEIVVMELLAGARSARHAEMLRETLLAFPVLSLQGLASYEAAATLYRSCRRAGKTVRRMTDCLIAVAAIEAGVPILHAGSDFDALAAHTDLKIHPLDVAG